MSESILVIHFLKQYIFEICIRRFHIYLFAISLPFLLVDFQFTKYFVPLARMPDQSHFFSANFLDITWL